MGDGVVIGGQLTIEFPALVRQLAAQFNVIVFDMLQLGQTLDFLTGLHLDAAIVLLLRSEFVGPMTLMMTERGATVDHFLGLGDRAAGIAAGDPNRMGLCTYLDASRTESELVADVMGIVASCPHHCPRPVDAAERMPSTETEHGVPLRSTLEATIASFVALGLSDKEISERLHYSPQTIRNKISRMLHDNGFDNRTELAIAHLHSEFRGLLDPPPA